MNKKSSYKRAMGNSSERKNWKESRRINEGTSVTDYFLGLECAKGLLWVMWAKASFYLAQKPDVNKQMDPGRAINVTQAH